MKSFPITDRNGKTKALNINMRVETVEGFSGHSDRNQLLAYVRNLKPKPKRVFVNHGEAGNAVDFSKALANRFKLNATALNNLDAIRLK